MPKLIGLYIRSCAIGFLAAAGFVALIVWQDIAGLGHLVLGSADGWLAGVMLFIANGIVFSGVQFGIAIMAMAEKDDRDGGGKRDDLPLAEPVPIPVRVRNR